MAAWEVFTLYAIFKQLPHAKNIKMPRLTMKEKRWRSETLYSLVFSTAFLAMLYTPAHEARAVDEPYSVISKKNLFSPDRKEWFMEKTDNKVIKAAPKIDTKQIKLLGTVIVGTERKAVIKNSLKRGTGQGVDVYMPGDYIEGYLLKEINEKKVLLTNTDANDSVEIFLREGTAQRSAEKTEIKEEAPEPAAGKRIRRPKAETTADLTDRMKESRALLKNRDSENVRLQVERDFQKLKDHMGDLSPQQQQEAILLKKEIDRAKAQNSRR
jgi:hypothetical protein